MLDKILSVLLIIGLISTANFSILAQTQSSGSKKSQQPSNLSKKEFFNFKDRANNLLDEDSFAKVNENSLSPKAMEEAGKAQQKKKFAGIGTTTAIIIGGAIVAAIVIVLATKGKKENNVSPRCDFPPYCNF